MTQNACDQQIATQETETMTDDTRDPAALLGSHGPAAWALLLPGRDKRLFATRKEAEEHLEFWLDTNPIRSADDGKMIPLFALTEAAVDALEYVVEVGLIACPQDAEILRSLLAAVRPGWNSKAQPERA
jgi:hypothetical protein